MEEILKEIDKLSEEDSISVLLYIFSKQHIKLSKESVRLLVYSKINDMSILITSSLKDGKIEEL